jgi:hypothetical protein
MRLCAQVAQVPAVASPRGSNGVIARRVGKGSYAGFRPVQKPSLGFICVCMCVNVHVHGMEWKLDELSKSVDVPSLHLLDKQHGHVADNVHEALPVQFFRVGTWAPYNTWTGRYSLTTAPAYSYTYSYSKSPSAGALSPSASS